MAIIQISWAYRTNRWKKFGVALEFKKKVINILIYINPYISVELLMTSSWVLEKNRMKI